MAHGHHHAHALEARRAGNRKRMWWALAINFGLLAATLVGGIVSDSLALLADAGHLLSDVGAIGVGLLAAKLAGMAPTPARTFGYQRSEILGALVNGVTLVAIAVLIVIGAITRLSDPPEVSGTGVLVLGLVGLAGNGAAAWVLASGEREDINLEGVLRHSAADALGSLAVVVAGVVVLATDWDAIDPLVSLAISGLIIAGSWRLLKEPIGVLMEAAPPGIGVDLVGRVMTEDPDVVEVHDLHVWSVTSGFPALAAHLVVRPGADRDLVRRRVEAVLSERFSIRHTTLQVVESTGVHELIAVEDLGGQGGGARSGDRPGGRSPRQFPR
jgi:cobalt-zinc-cadmium efflux system protein